MFWINYYLPINYCSFAEKLMSKSAENNGLDRWERNYFVSVMSSQFRGTVYISKDQQQRKMCLKTEETKTWGRKCSNLSPNLPTQSICFINNIVLILFIFQWWIWSWFAVKWRRDKFFCWCLSKVKGMLLIFLDFFFLLLDSLLVHYFTAVLDNSQPVFSNTLQDFRFFFDFNWTITIASNPPCQIKVAIMSRSCKIKCCRERIDSFSPSHISVSSGFGSAIFTFGI